MGLEITAPSQHDSPTANMQPGPLLVHAELTVGHEPSLPTRTTRTAMPGATPSRPARTLRDRYRDFKGWVAAGRKGHDWGESNQGFSEFFGLDGQGDDSRYNDTASVLEEATTPLDVTPAITVAPRDRHAHHSDKPPGHKPRRTSPTGVAAAHVPLSENFRASQPRISRAWQTTRAALRSADRVIGVSRGIRHLSESAQATWWLTQFATLLVADPTVRKGARDWAREGVGVLAAERQNVGKTAIASSTVVGNSVRRELVERFAARKEVRLIGAFGVRLATKAGTGLARVRQELSGLGRGGTVSYDEHGITILTGTARRPRR